MQVPVIISTGDGSDTLFVPGMNEQYHSIHGAISESEYIFLDCGYRYFMNSLHHITFVSGKENQTHPGEKRPGSLAEGRSGQTGISMLEIGFGTGLNCLLTVLEATRSEIYTRYYGIEKYPLPVELVKKLNYPLLTGKGGSEFFDRIHEAPWDQKVMITPFFELLKIRDDFISADLADIRDIGVVYFDAFGPEKQPGMWDTEQFRKLYLSMKEGGVLTTFSAKGSVRRGLMAAGFVVERLPGPKGKREILRALKI